MIDKNTEVMNNQANYVIKILIVMGIVQLAFTIILAYTVFATTAVRSVYVYDS